MADDSMTLSERLQALVGQADAAGVAAFKKDGDALLVRAWVCFELGAGAPEDRARSAVHHAGEYLAAYGRTKGGSYYPAQVISFLTPDLEAKLAECFEMAGSPPDRPMVPMEDMADLTVCASTDDDKPGYIHVTVKDGERLVFDEALDPVSAPEMFSRIMAGDEKLLGRVAMLRPKGPLGDRWWAYWQKYIPRPPNARVLRDVRRAFFAGAYASLIYLRSGEASPPDADSWWKEYREADVHPEASEAQLQILEATFATGGVEASRLLDADGKDEDYKASLDAVIAEIQSVLEREMGGTTH